MYNQKKCRQCEATKPSSEFSKDKTSTDGLMRICRTCNVKKSQYSAKKYREKNLLQPLVMPQFRKCSSCLCVLPSSEFYRAKSLSSGLSYSCKECTKKQLRKWAKENPEKFLECGRKYQRKYYRTNLHHIKLQLREAKEKDPVRFIATHLLHAAKNRAKKHHLPCSLSRDWIMEKLLTGKCEMTGLKLDLRSSSKKNGKRTANSPSLDRVSPQKGYTNSNTMMVIWAFNAFKGTWSYTDLNKLAVNFIKTKRTSSIVYRDE